MFCKALAVPLQWLYSPYGVPSAVKMASLVPDDSLLHFSQLKSCFYQEKWDTFHFEKVQPSNVVFTSGGTRFYSSFYLFKSILKLVVNV